MTRAGEALRDLGLHRLVTPNERVEKLARRDPSVDADARSFCPTARRRNVSSAEVALRVLPLNLRSEGEARGLVGGIGCAPISSRELLMRR